MTEWHLDPDVITDIWFFPPGPLLVTRRSRVAQFTELSSGHTTRKAAPNVPDREIMNIKPSIREFTTGATRDTEEGKHDPEGFLSPRVLERYFQYMHKNRLQADGQLRASDNWQKGIPAEQYMKSLWRHFFTVWKTYREYRTAPGGPCEAQKVVLEEALCGVMFNAMGFLYEALHGR